MNKLIFQLYRIIVPKPVRTIILKKNLRLKILRHFASLPANEINKEQQEVMDFLKKNPISIFPYSFSKNYRPGQVEVLYDTGVKLKYVIHEGHRLYFRRGWGTKRIQRAWSDLLREQDPSSPHRYLTESFNPGKNDVILDIGAAEGNFSLSIVDKVKKIYLFENDRRWNEALRATFAPWGDKVEIINKFVADRNDTTHVSIDRFIEEKELPGFIKIDVDGAEDSVLRSCKHLFQSGKPLKIALCTYHKQDDENVFTALLENVGFTVEPSNGYMIHYYDKKIAPPWLRRGLLRASR